MAGYLGIDTSNYTTSAAVFDDETGNLLQKKELLPVKEGALGLRQSDAVFHHTCQLPEMVEAVLSQYDGRMAAVAASDRPCQAEDSYMPCFLTGIGSARQLAAVLHVPLFRFTHQQGHVAAAACGAGHIELLEQDFIAFHVSGGTTDALYVHPDNHDVIRCEMTLHSLDLKAGQLIDRVGLLLGLPFPAGPKLEQLALKATGSYSPKPVLRDGNCSLSGVENQCQKRKQQGQPDEEVALFCLMSVLAAVDGMTVELQKRYPGLPILYAGGVMSNLIIREALEKRFHGYFAPPAFSSDNAAGIAMLARMQSERNL